MRLTTALEHAHVTAASGVQVLESLPPHAVAPAASSAARTLHGRFINNVACISKKYR
jgi:hypothetical protein